MITSLAGGGLAIGGVAGPVLAAEGVAATAAPTAGTAVPGLTTDAMVNSTVQTITNAGYTAPASAGAEAAGTTAAEQVKNKAVEAGASKAAETALKEGASAGAAQQAADAGAATASELATKEAAQTAARQRVGTGLLNAGSTTQTLAQGDYYSDATLPGQAHDFSALADLPVQDDPNKIAALAAGEYGPPNLSTNNQQSTGGAQPGQPKLGEGTFQLANQDVNMRNLQTGNFGDTSKPSNLNAINKALDDSTDPEGFWSKLTATDKALVLSSSTSAVAGLAGGIATGISEHNKTKLAKYVANRQYKIDKENQKRKNYAPLVTFQNSGSGASQGLLNARR